MKTSWKECDTVLSFVRGWRKCLKKRKFVTAKKPPPWLKTTDASNAWVNACEAIFASSGSVTMYQQAQRVLIAVLSVKGLANIPVCWGDEDVVFPSVCELTHDVLIEACEDAATLLKSVGEPLDDEPPDYPKLESWCRKNIAGYSERSNEQQSKFTQWEHDLLVNGKNTLA